MLTVAAWLMLATLVAILWQLVQLREQTADSWWRRAFDRLPARHYEPSATWDDEVQP